MTRPETAEEAWNELLQYARQPEVTIETAKVGSENEMGVDSNQKLFFRKESGYKRKVPRTEFTAIWQTFSSNGEITRKQVGNMTSARAGSALFGAMSEIFSFELDLSSSPIRLYYSQQ